MKTTQEIDQQIQDLKNHYAEKILAVRKNHDLSDRGKEKAIAQLKEEKTQALKSFVPDLRTQAVEVAVKIKKLQGALGALKRNEGDQIDFTRLTYEATACRSAAAMAKDDPFTLQEQWNRIKEGNDVHKAKAWADTLPSLVPDKTAHASTWDELLNDIAANQGVVHGEEANRYERERKGLLNSLAEVSRTTGSIAEELSGGVGYKGRNLIGRVFKGIALDRESNQLVTNLGPVEGESLDSTLDRLSAEDTEQALAQQEVANAFGVQLDPLLDLDPEAE